VEFFLGSRGALNLCYVTDGGVHENLGIRVLLKRRCRLIIACDAGCDTHYVFEDLAHLLRLCRTRDGIDITPLTANGIEGLRPLKRNSQKKTSGSASAKDADSAEGEPHSLPTRALADSHFTAFEIKYPPLSTQDRLKQQPETGLLLYFKSALTGDEPLELKQYALSHPIFPQDSTADQFYPPEQFESYRQLGFHLFDSLRREPTSSSQCDDDVENKIRKVAGEFVQHGCASHILEKMFGASIRSDSCTPSVI
jgi:hypothetical protein